MASYRKSAAVNCEVMVAFRFTSTNNRMPGGKFTASNCRWTGGSILRVPISRHAK